MLYFVAGRKNSGKTATVHKLLGDAVSKGEGGMLIVPKQYTFESDRSILKLLGPRLACEVEVLSFSRLAHAAVKTFGGIAKPTVKQGVRAIFMSLALRGLEDKLRVFASHKNEMALVNKMLAAYDDMKLSGVTYTQLEEAADRIDDKLLSEKLKETAMIFRTFEAVISAEHFDDGDLLDRVYDILKGTDFFSGKTVVIDGFRDFTHPERKLISLMISKAKEVYITLCTDDPAEINEMSRFEAVNKSYRRLVHDASRSGIACKTITVDGRQENVLSPELNFLEENIFSPVFTPYEGEAKDIGILCAPVLEEECDAVARRIKEHIRSGNYRCRDIAVVYRQDSRYEKNIRRALKKYGVDIFEDRRQPVANQPLITFVRNLLLICAEGFDSEYVFRYLKTGLTSLTQEEIAEIENYTFTWDISGKKWLTPWTGHPEGFGVEADEKSIAALEKINGLRERAVAAVAYLAEKLRDATGKQAITLLYNFLRENGIDENLKNYAVSLEEDGFTELALEQEQVWDLLMEAFDEIATALGDIKVGTARLSELFAMVVAYKSLGKLPDGYDEVFISTADRMLTKNAKIVFAVGFNAGVFPLTARATGLFAEHEKRKLTDEAFDFFSDDEGFVSKERFFVYTALAAATEKLYLSYSTLSSVGEKLTHSEVIDRLHRLFPKIKETAVAKDGEMLYIQSPQSAFEYTARKWREGSDLTATLRHYFSSRGDFAHKLESISRGTDGKPFAFESKERAVALFGENMRFSATRLETYSKCPFMYFCRYGLHLEPRAKAKLDPALGGTIVHHVLETVLKKYPGKTFTALSDDELQKETDVCLFGYMDKFMGGRDAVSDRFFYLFSRMRKIVFSLLVRLRCEFENSDFEPCDFELHIGGDDRVSPFSVALEKGKAEIIGYVDRVDKMDLNGRRYVRVVDYKTGGKDFALGDVFSGMNMQMLLYLMSIWRTGKGFYENIIPSGVLYFPAKLSPVDADRNASQAKRNAAVLSKGKMSGMLVGDDEAICHMDKTKEFLFLPVKYDAKKDLLKGNFISVAQLEKLGGIIDGTVKKMGDALHEGLIPASPIFASGHRDTCIYCDYFDVCMKENPDYRLMKKLSHDDCLRALEGGEEDGEKLD